MEHGRQQMSDSFLGETEGNPLAPIRTSEHPQRNPVFYGSHVQARKTTNQYLNVLAPLAASSKLEFKEDFQNQLVQDDTNSNLIIATVLGPKGSGKSFLVDFMVSKEEKSASRLMSKNGRPLLNMPTYELKGVNNQRVLLLDAHEQLSNEGLLWAYFLSSVFVLNLPHGDTKAHTRFLQQLDTLRASIESDPEDLSLPHLILVRRDAPSKQFNDKQLVRQIEDSGLFQTDTTTLNMAYPGGKDVKSRDIIEVSESLLNPQFVNDANNLCYMIKSSRSKMIKGNQMGSKIAALSLQPLTKSINKQGKINTNQIWADVIETLSVGYYNYYMKKYFEELQGQFGDQKPCDKYTLYKRLSKVRRNVDRKVEGFNAIAGDPTFEKYREKLQEKIAAKEKMIKEINKRKSIEHNDTLCKQLFSNMNDSNCEALIDQYCKSGLDDHKAEVLLDNFEEVIKQRQKQLENSRGIKPSAQIVQLQAELQQLDKKIDEEKKSNVKVVNYDFGKIRANIEAKEKEVQELQEQLQRQKQISQEKRRNQNKDVIELQEKINGLKKTTKEQEVQIEKLKATKEAQAKQTIEELNRRLRGEEERYQRLQQEVRKAQASTMNAKTKQTKPAAKDTCCEVM